MKTITTSGGETAEAIARNLDQLESEARALLGGRGRDPIGGNRAAVRDQCRDLRLKAVAGVRVADAAVRTHPYGSLAIAVGLGALLGAFVRRRRE
ncbi:MAG TPA: hypothetical protein VHE13_03115 [Opitutus sp.]|nr:hypothetical protein [Opitutus sp.]